MSQITTHEETIDGKVFVVHKLSPLDAQDILIDILDAVAPLIDGGISGIGIGVAGLVDHTTGTLDWMPHMAGERVPISAPVGPIATSSRQPASVTMSASRRIATCLATPSS